ncbi:hypothetical protein ACIGO9_28645 [Nocardia asteroides]|uniref:hypothetical protein n=1 Tax=Nocardia asteroides TaxID=1824 RepID=UPI0037C7F4D8
MWNPYFLIGDAMLSLRWGSPVIRGYGVDRLAFVYRQAVIRADSSVAARVVEVAVEHGVSIPPFARPGGVVLGRRVSLVK